MNEADKKRELVREINALPGGYARRLEDRYAIGVLDLIIKLPAYPALWAEGKIVEGNLFAPTARQWEEGRRILAAGMPVLLLGWKERWLYVSPWVKKADIRTCFGGDGPSLQILQEALGQERIRESR